MKGIYLITIAFVASWAVTTANEYLDQFPTRCPAKDPENTTIYIPHESDCTKYYKCVKGEKILQQCPIKNSRGDRLHFNPKIQACDWGWQCFVKHNQAEVTNERSISEEESHKSVVMPQTYYECPERNPNWRNTTIHIPHESDCTKFYTCPLRVLRDCPFRNKRGDRLHFNKRLMVCDWPGNARCEYRNVKQDKLEATNEQSILERESNKPAVMNEIPTKCPAVDPKNTTVHLPHETDCTKYYMCLGGMKFVQQCPFMNEKGDRLHFNPKIQACDWPALAGCEKNFEQNQPEATNEQSISKEESNEAAVI